MSTHRVIKSLSIAAVVAAVALSTGAVGTYNGLNKGVTVGSCGFEVIGTFGPFCGDQITIYPLPSDTDEVPPCLEEDFAGPCYWDASTRGNGFGRSFTVDADQVVHYGATR